MVPTCTIRLKLLSSLKKCMMSLYHIVHGLCFWLLAFCQSPCSESGWRMTDACGMNIKVPFSRRKSELDFTSLTKRNKLFKRKRLKIAQHKRSTLEIFSILSIVVFRAPCLWLSVWPRANARKGTISNVWKYSACVHPWLSPHWALLKSLAFVAFLQSALYCRNPTFYDGKSY